MIQNYLNLCFQVQRGHNFFFKVKTMINFLQSVELHKMAHQI